MRLISPGRSCIAGSKSTPYFTLMPGNQFWRMMLPVIFGPMAVVYRRAMRLLRTIWAFLVRVCLCKGFGRIVAEFLTEVAVLVLVFPILDTIIQKGQSNVTKSLVILSVVLTVSCLFVAGIISKAGEE